MSEVSEFSRAPGARPKMVQSSGLEGVVVAATRLSHVDGARGELVIAGARVEDLALGSATAASRPGGRYEQVGQRLLELGDGVARPNLSEEIARARVAAFERVPDLHAALTLPNPMDSLLAALAQGCPGGEVCDVLGALPVYVAAGARLRAGKPALAPEVTRGQAEDFLAMLGEACDGARSRALDAYWVTVCDHGLNASTFAARVVASTGSDRVPCVLAALGALKGPLHGGAPGPVLDMLDATRGLDAAAWLRSELEAGRRIMGMGHRIYRVRDPRAFVLERALSELEQGGPGAPWSERLAHARAVERTAEALLRERHPDRPLKANVEFYTALLLEALAIPRSFFTATFAVGRALGWLAHIEEQRRTGRLIRPAADYVGQMPTSR